MGGARGGVGITSQCSELQKTKTVKTIARTGNASGRLIKMEVQKHNDVVNKLELPSAQRKELKNELKSQNIKTTI